MYADWKDILEGICSWITVIGIAMAATVTVVLLFFCIADLIVKSRLEYEEFEATAKVTEMRGREARSSTYVIPGKANVPVRVSRSARHDIYVVYDGIKYCIKDEEWFEKVNVGDIIQVIVHKGHDSKDQVRDIYLTFPEE